MAYDALNARLSVTPINVADLNRSQTKKIYESTFAHSPSYYEVSINSSPTLTGVQIVDDSDTVDQKRITSIDYAITNGDIVDWQCHKWINILTDNMGDGLYYRGTLKRCVSSIKWLDEEGLVKEAWFTYKTDISRSLGLIEGNLMLLPSERRYILLPKNQDTTKIEKGKRFIFDDRAWKVMSIDRLNNDLIYFELEEHDINTASDNTSLRIADYVGNVANYTLKIMNGDFVSVHAGQSYQLNVEVRNNDVVISKPLVYTSSNTSIATVTNTGIVNTIANGSVVISVSMVDNPTVSDSINVTVEFSTSNNYTVNIIGDDYIYNGTSKTYNEQVKNNGVVDNTRFVQWYLYDDTGTKSTDLATMTFSSTTQCTLKANSLGKSGYVKLKTVVIGSTTVVDIKRIQIKTLI